MIYQVEVPRYLDTEVVDFGVNRQSPVSPNVNRCCGDGRLLELEQLAESEKAAEASASVTEGQADSSCRQRARR